MIALDHSHPHNPLPVAPLPVHDVGGEKSEQEIEYPHDCTEFCSVAGGPAGVVDGQDDDFQEDTQDVDSQTEENGVFIVWESNTPDKTAQEHQVVDQGCLEYEW